MIQMQEYSCYVDTDKLQCGAGKALHFFTKIKPFYWVKKKKKQK